MKESVETEGRPEVRAWDDASDEASGADSSEKMTYPATRSAIALQPILKANPNAACSLAASGEDLQHAWWQQVEGEGEDEVDHQHQNADEPGGAAVVGDE